MTTKHFDCVLLILFYSVFSFITRLPVFMNQNSDSFLAIYTVTGINGEILVSPGTVLRLMVLVLALVLAMMTWGDTGDKIIPVTLDNTKTIIKNFILSKTLTSVLSITLILISSTTLARDFSLLNGLRLFESFTFLTLMAFLDNIGEDDTEEEVEIEMNVKIMLDKEDKSKS